MEYYCTKESRSLERKQIQFRQLLQSTVVPKIEKLEGGNRFRLKYFPISTTLRFRVSAYTGTQSQPTENQNLVDEVLTARACPRERIFDFDSAAATQRAS